jgi:ATP-dependent Clp protease ATP-binding subunit ClpA
MFRKLKDRAAAVKTISELLTRAEEIAHRRGAAQPGAEHLVSAALQLPDGTAARALERLGRTPADFDAALIAQEADDLERIGIHVDHDRIGTELPPPSDPVGIYRSEPSAQELFQAAGADAGRGGGTLVGAHVLRAAASLKHGPTARALRRMGIDSSELRQAATAVIEGQRST